MAKSTKAGATTLAIINAYVRERMIGNFLSEFTVTRGKESSQLEGRTDWGVEIRCTLPTLNWWRNKRGGFGFMCGALHISYSLVSDPTDAGEWEAQVTEHAMSHQCIPFQYQREAGIVFGDPQI